MDDSGPKPLAMKTVQKHSKDVGKRIPRVIRYIGGDKPRKTKQPPTFAIPADAILNVLSTLNRVNKELPAMVLDENTINPIKNQKLVADLTNVRDVLERLQRPFQSQ